MRNSRGRLEASFSSTFELFLGANPYSGLPWRVFFLWGGLTSPWLGVSGDSCNYIERNGHFLLIQIYKKMYNTALV